MASDSNGNTFKEFIKDVLASFEAENIFNAVIVLDNVQFHKNFNAREMIERSGHRILFCPIFPILNPINNMLSKWKQLIRQLKPENEEHLFNLINETASVITPEN